MPHAKHIYLEYVKWAPFRQLEYFYPDVILSKYKLPNLNGIAALEIVRHDHPEVPVIMVTGVLTQSIVEPDPAIPHQNFTKYPPGL
jgi:CheY-like chemotaxis protein